MSPIISRMGTFNEGFELRLFTFSDDGFLCSNLLNKLINISPAWCQMYYEERLRRSMDLV